MTEEFFAQKSPRASGSNTLISVLILAVVSSVLTALSSLIWGGTQMAFLPPEYREMTAAGAGSNVVCSLCSGLIGAVAGKPSNLDSAACNVPAGVADKNAAQEVVDTAWDAPEMGAWSGWRRDNRQPDSSGAVP